MTMLFAAVHESACGTKRTCLGSRRMSVDGGKADFPIERPDVRV